MFGGKHQAHPQPPGTHVVLAGEQAQGEGCWQGLFHRNNVQTPQITVFTPHKKLHVFLRKSGAGGDCLGGRAWAPRGDQEQRPLL